MQQSKLFDQCKHIGSYKKLVIGQTIQDLGWQLDKDIEQIDNLFEVLDNNPIEMRIDPLFGEHTLHSSLISRERANRPIATRPELPDLVGPDKCPFCAHNIAMKTPVNKRVYHSQPGIVSVSNLYPYIAPHYVTIFKRKHTADFKDLTEKNIQTYLMTGKELSELFKEKEENGIDGMWDFINWGPKSGASQPHAHAQRGGLYPLVVSLMDREREALKRRKQDLHGKDPFEVYISAAKEGKLTIYEDKYVYIFAAYAPRFTNQVDVITKKKNGKVVSNYLELDTVMIRSIAKGVVHVLQGMATELNIANLSIEAHQARFVGDEDYRLHWHIYSRESVIGGMELNDMYAVAAYPEKTAEILRGGI